jgi:hypothetical protein
LPEHEEAFNKAKEHLSSAKNLAFYDLSTTSRLQVDASRLFGPGFDLKQETSIWKTVQAGSHFLSKAETRYAMIELEMLAIAWACKKCSMFIEGLTTAQFTIWTDHQPLVPILMSLPQIENSCLQRLRMKVDHLHFTVQWAPDKTTSKQMLCQEHHALWRPQKTKLTRTFLSMLPLLSSNV